MKKILLTCDSTYGATATIAEIIAETIVKKSIKVDLCPIGSVNTLKYDLLIIGSPIRMGRCLPRTKNFLQANLDALSKLQVAFFFSCMMSVTESTPEMELPVFLDPTLINPDRPQARFRFMENSHSASYYLTQLLKIIPGVSPSGIAYFRGRLNTAELSISHKLIMRFAKFALPEIHDGDYINPPVVRTWTENLIDRIWVT